MCKNYFSLSLKVALATNDKLNKTADAKIVFKNDAFAFVNLCGVQLQIQQ